MIKGFSFKSEFFLILSLVMLIGIGLVLVFSATYSPEQNWLNSLWFKQAVFFIVGALVVIFLIRIPLKWLNQLAIPFYIISLFLLAFLALGGGVSTKGAGRWIMLGPINFQPSEFAKIAYMLVLCKMMSNVSLNLDNIKKTVPILMVFIVPFLLVLKQPDLSTALVFMVMTLATFFWCGLRVSDLIFLFSPMISIIASVHQLAWGIFFVILILSMIRFRIKMWLFSSLAIANIGAAYAAFLVWNKLLQDHQRSRILTFLDPMRDPRGEGYQVIQSKIAIGSGGMNGKGFLQGSQTNLNFLPEEHTDFIFSVLGEQFGFWGSVFVLLLYGLLLYNILRIVTIKKNTFGNLLLICIGSALSFHILVNVAMTLGLMPVTGLPLPFLSYGGTFVVTCMIWIGIVLCVRYRSESDSFFKE
jgi:rod shape determining protein RodA